MVKGRVRPLLHRLSDFQCQRGLELKKTWALFCFFTCKPKNLRLPKTATHKPNNVTSFNIFKQLWIFKNKKKSYVINFANNYTGAQEFLISFRAMKWNCMDILSALQLSHSQLSRNSLVPAPQVPTPCRYASFTYRKIHLSQRHESQRQLSQFLLSRIHLSQRHESQRQLSQFL
jgi:hypothetical protein